MTDQPFDDAPEGEFVDLTAVSLVVETTLYDEECDEITPIEVVAGAEPFILLNMAQKEGENTLAYQMLGSMINTEADLLLSIEAFADALRAKLEQEGATIDGEVVNRQRSDDEVDAAVNEYLDEELTRANEDATIRSLGG